MAITDLNIPYDNFQTGDTIQASEFNSNNSAIETKVNEVITQVNDNLADKSVDEEVTGNWEFTGNADIHSRQLVSNDNDVEYLRLCRIKWTGGSSVYSRSNVRFNLAHTGTFVKYGQIHAYMYKINSNGSLHSTVYAYTVNDSGNYFNFEDGDIVYQNWIPTTGTIGYTDIYIKVKNYAKIHSTLDFAYSENGCSLIIDPDGGTMITSIPATSSTLDIDGVINTAEASVNSDVVSNYLYGTTSTSATSYTASFEDEVILVDASSNNVTVNLPDATGSDLNVIRKGKQYIIKRVDTSSNTVTIDGYSTQTIDGSTSKTLDSQYDSIVIVNDGSNWHIGSNYSVSSGTNSSGLTVINETTLTSDTASYSASWTASDYTDVILEIDTCKGTSASTGNLTFNSDTGTNYHMAYYYSTTTAITNQSSQSAMVLNILFAGSTDNANKAYIHINLASNTVNFNINQLRATNNRLVQGGCAYVGSSVISSLSLSPSTGSILTGTHFRLLGVNAPS